MEFCKMSEFLMTEPLDSLSMYDLNWRIAFLMEEKDHLREEMLKAREHVSENFNNRIIAAYLRQLIIKINTRSSELIREVNRRTVNQRQNQN